MAARLPSDCILRPIPALSPPDALLGTRRQGLAERGALEGALDAAPPVCVLALDLRSTLYINHAFTDELLGVLYERLRAGFYPDRYPVIVATPEGLDDRLANVPVALERRDLAALAVPSPDGIGEPRMIGRLSDTHRRTFVELRPGDTNGRLAERLGIKLTACANRTEHLSKKRLVRRRRRGGEPAYKQYEFSPVLGTE